MENKSKINREDIPKIIQCLVCCGAAIKLFTDFDKETLIKDCTHEEIYNLLVTFLEKDCKYYWKNCCFYLEK